MARGLRISTNTSHFIYWSPDHEILGVLRIRIDLDIVLLRESVCLIPCRPPTHQLRGCEFLIALVVYSRQVGGGVARRVGHRELERV
jgi:hypothetical protein